MSVSEAERLDDEAKRREWKRLKQLQSDSGAYFESSIPGFEIGTDQFSSRRQSVVDRLTGCAGRVNEFVNGGYGLILWGRAGTGKDHLAVAILRRAAVAGYTARWAQGTSLYERASSSWKSKSGSPSKELAAYVRCDCLVISDPVFIRNWSQAKSETFAKIVRDRYDKGKPTWITNNAKDLDQLKDLCVPDVYDRLSERAVIEQFDWPSYRQEVACEF